MSFKRNVAKDGLQFLKLVERSGQLTSARNVAHFNRGRTVANLFDKVIEDLDGFN